MAKKEHLNLVFIGHVDAGKSTTVGRMLYETGAVSEQVLNRLKDEAQKLGKATFEFAFVMDALKEERERGVTIDIAHRNFETAKYYCTIIDAPGHRDFVKNMITGASQADAAVLVISVKDGVQPQTKEHAFLAKVLGVSQLAVNLNKMDAVGYKKEEYEKVKEEATKLLKGIGYKVESVPFVPCSSYAGDNLTKKSANMTWYTGPTLLEIIDSFIVPPKPVDKDLRLPIQDVFTITGHGTVPVGRVETGKMKPGDMVVVMPSGAKGEVKKIEMHHQELTEAMTGDNVGFHLKGVEKKDIKRGDVLGPATKPPTVADEFTGINPYEFRIKLDNDWIHREGSDSEFWEVTYDQTSQLLKIWMTGGFEDAAAPANNKTDVRPLSLTGDLPPIPCGSHTLWVSAKNGQNNEEEFTWNFTVDCTAPTVVFDNYYVSKNPTIHFNVSDDMSGVDFDWIFVDVVAVRTTDTNWANPNQSESLFYLGTFSPDMVEYYSDPETGDVDITTHYELEDERFIMVAIYGYYDYDYGYGDWYDYYGWNGYGVWDCVSNVSDPWFQVLAVDYDGPVFDVVGEEYSDALPSGCPVTINVHDDGSGVERVEVYEDGIMITDEERVTWNATNGYLSYCPESGRDVMMIAYDNVGNSRQRNWSATGGGQVVDAGEAFNYPNPFDPRSDSYTTIESGFRGYVNVTIYDFAGETVWSTTTNNDGTTNWYGYTSEGEPVASGVYFAYCKAGDGRHKVVKIAIIRK